MPHLPPSRRPHPHPWLAALSVAALALAGCPSEVDDRLPSCATPDDLAVNTLVGVVGGEGWTGTTGGYQMVAGPALQVSATGTDEAARTVNVVLRLLVGSRFSVDEETDEVERREGTDIEDALEDKETPYDFALGDASDVGANATVTISPNPSMSTGEGVGDGFLRIESIGVPDDAAEGAPEELSGCFHLTAETQDGASSVAVEEGGFRLTAL